METRWLYRTSGDFNELVEASGGVCVIPMGCIEKHGLHMPLGTDTIAASMVTYLASQIEPVCVFPDFIFGDVPEGSPKMHPGTVTIPVETEILMLETLCTQIARNGFRKILVINGHGGNVSWLNVFMRKMTTEKRNFVFGHIELPLVAPHTMAEKLIEEGSGCMPDLTSEDEATILRLHEQKMRIGHACMGEASYIMGCAPESVHLEYLGVEAGRRLHILDHYSKAGISIHAWPYDCPTAYGGDDPVDCNERIGKAALKLGAEIIAERIKLFKEDEVFWNCQEEFQQGW